MLIELCSLEEVPIDTMKRVDKTIDDKLRKFCVVNFGDTVYVIDDTCSHAEFSLSDGFLDTDKCEVECWKHSATFDLKSGKPTCLPATQAVATYVTDVVGDKVFIEIEESNV